MIIAFIPARGGSKSIPKKNIKLLGGKPLIAYSIETALQCGLRTIVNTDDPEIAKVVREYGAEVMEMTPKEAKERGIHQDTSSMYQVLKSEIPRIEPIPELVLLLQATSPFRKKIHIKTALSALGANLDKFDSLIAAERVPEKYHPAQVIVSTPLGLRMANGSPISQRITRRQGHGEAWIPTGSIYLFKTSNLEKGSFYGERPMVIEVEPDININDQSDWEEAELWLKNQKAS